MEEYTALAPLLMNYPWLYHDFAMTLLWLCYGFAMSKGGSRQDFDMLIPTGSQLSITDVVTPLN